MTYPEERESVARARMLEAFEGVCPHVAGNKYIKHWPLPAQAVFLGMHRSAKFAKKSRVFQCLYGGAAGGGKSDALLMAAAQYVHDPTFSAIMFRRTHTDLAQPGALLDRAHDWWSPQGVHWDGQNKIFRFPSGAKVAMAYLSKPNDHLRYQGAEYQYTAWDELTQWPDARPYEYVGFSRVRRSSESTAPLRTLSASNPGGPGHVWVHHKFVGDEDAGIEPEWPYIPARIQDNPYLDRESYEESLMMLHPTVRDQLLRGDWRARDPGDYFRADWFGPLLDPKPISEGGDLWPSADCIRVRWWDLAASEKPDAAFTSGVKMARHRSGVRAVEHCRSFRATPGRRDDLIVQTARADGPSVTVGLEIEGGSGGPAQFYALETRLKAEGFRVVGARPKVDLTDAEGLRLYRNPAALTGKTGRADPVASCLERGYQRRGESPDTGAPWHGLDENAPPYAQKDGVRLFAGPWTQSYLDVVEGFPDGATCDEVDATSGAWGYLEAHPFGHRVAATQRDGERPLAEPQNVHPEERKRVTPRFWTP